VYVSRNGDNWGAPVWRGQLPGNANWQVVRFDAPVTGRYIRVVARSGHAQGPWAAVAEVDLIVNRP
jgi:hypothetical protein